MTTAKRYEVRVQRDNEIKTLGNWQLTYKRACRAIKLLKKTGLKNVWKSPVTIKI